MTGLYFEDNDGKKAEKTFYYHKITGGMAASGADTYYEKCLILNDKIVISEIKKGHFLNYTSSARCSWQIACNLG